MSISASPAKLRDGSWGARVQSEQVSTGDLLTITTKAGKTWNARVTRVVWAGEGVSICATESMERPTSQGSETSRTRIKRSSCRECSGPLVNASHHRAMGGLCGSCAFDEYDM